MPVYLKYDGWYVFFWSNENTEPIHFHIAKGSPTENSTKIWILKNGSFQLENNNSKVPPKILRRILAIMQVSIKEYESLWLEYQKEIRHIK